ncbi:hypothetical protein WA026_006566 [Henosepilachna vigintioctopunctata]|uniref:Uncharacterized protein n=1 Tax=Henosepilachna vigintioctopunctata TaxID=420089 RepID=A0AAW1UH10_9CUCU
MVLETHVTKPFQQLPPIVLSLLPGIPFSSSLLVPVLFHIPTTLFTVPSISVSSVSVSPFVSLYTFFRSIVPVLLRNLRFVIGFIFGGKFIMDFFFNRVIRRKPPLDGVQRSS